MAYEKEKQQSETSQPVKDQLKEQRQRTHDARKKIENAFSDKRTKLRTPLADYTEQTVLAILTNPLDQLQEEIDNFIQGNQDKVLPESQLKSFEDRRKEAVDIATQYIEKMSKESGGITAEVLERMVSDINKKAGRFMDLINSGKNHDLVEALKAALGSQGESADLPTAEKKAVETLKEKTATEFPKGDRGLMPVIWSIMSFMRKELKLEIAKNYLNKFPQQTDKFLTEGNIKGVFTGEDIQQLHPKKKYSEKELTTFAKNWQTQNDYRGQAMRLIIPVYGNENLAGKMLTIPNLLMTFGQFAAGVTIIGNFITGAFHGGEFKGIGPALDRLTNAQSLIAAGAIAAIQIYKSPHSLKEILEGKDPKLAAMAALKKEKYGNKNWKAWDSFFTQDNFAGALVFFDYIQSMKTIYKQINVDDLRDKLTVAGFSQVLGDMALRQQKGEKMKRNVNYAALKKSFDQIKANEIFTFAKIFDALNIGGATAKSTYEQAIKNIDTV